MICEFRISSPLPPTLSASTGERVGVRCRASLNYKPSTINHPLAHLRADRTAIASTNQLNQGETQEGAGNTQLIDALLGQFNHEVTELDAIMHNKYARVPDKLRAWRSASHVERAPQREKKLEPPAPTPPPANP